MGDGGGGSKDGGRRDAEWWDIEVFKEDVGEGGGSSSSPSVRRSVSGATDEGGVLGL